MVNQAGKICAENTAYTKVRMVNRTVAISMIAVLVVTIIVWNTIPLPGDQR